MIINEIIASNTVKIVVDTYLFNNYEILSRIYLNSKPSCTGRNYFDVPITRCRCILNIFKKIGILTLIILKKIMFIFKLNHISF